MAINLPIVTKFSDKGIKDAETALGKFGKFAAGAAAAATAAVVGIAVASVKEFAKFDSALNQSIAIMGDVSETMRGEMSDAAREVAKQTTFSAEQAAESFYFLASAGLSAEASIAAMPRVAKFAQAGMFDMARATDLATDAQSALGLTSDNAATNLENMTRVTDVFVKAATLANTSVEQLATAFTVKAGNALKVLGKDVEEGAAVLALFADQGIKGEQAGTLLNNTLFGLSDRAREASAQFEELGIEVFDTDGNMKNLADIAEDFTVALSGMTTEQQVNTIAQLGFNKQARTGLLALIGNADAIREYEGALRDAGGTVDEVANKQLQTFSAQMELLKSRVFDVFITIGSALVPVLLDLVNAFAPLIDEIAPHLEAFFVALAPLITQAGEFILNTFIPAMKGLFSIVTENADIIAVFVGTLGAMLLILNTAKVALVAVKVATAAYAVVQGILNAVLALNPLVLVAIAVAALVAGIVYLATRTTFFQDTWKAMTDGVTSAWQSFSAMFFAIIEAIGDFFTLIVTNIQGAWNTAVEDISKVAEFLGNGIESVFQSVGDFFGNILDGMLKGIKNFVNGGVSMFEGFANTVIRGMNGLIGQLNKISFTVPDWVPALGGKSFGFNVPRLGEIRIPRLAEGGIVLPQPGGVLANIAEAGQAEAVIPLDRLGDFGGGDTYNITINAGVGTDPVSVGRAVVNAIKRYESVSGKVFAPA
jgi:TP901 family phage tail tape measure protein